MATKENPVQPLLSHFFLGARAMIDECDKQAERWLEFGIAQTGEVAQQATKLAVAALRQGRAQAASTGRTVVDAFENLTRSFS
jgi:hypothetical protein